MSTEPASSVVPSSPTYPPTVPTGASATPTPPPTLPRPPRSNVDGNVNRPPRAERRRNFIANRRSLPPVARVVDDSASVTSEVSSSSDFGRGRNLPTSPIFYPLTPAQLNEARRIYNVEPIEPTYHLGQVLRGENPHGVLAFGRALAEHQALKFLDYSNHDQEYILDIGGSAGRHYSTGRDHVHSACPILSPADAVRQSGFPRSSDGQPNLWCNHRAEECGCQPFRAAIAVHSLYYLDAEAIISIIGRTSQRRMMAVVHRFPSIAGVLQTGEGAYHYYAADRVHMHVAGAQEPYEHSACAWLTTGVLEGARGVSVVARHRATLGDHYVYELTTVNYPIPRAVVQSGDWRAAIVSPSAGLNLALPSSVQGTAVAEHDLNFQAVRLHRYVVIGRVAFAYATVTESFVVCPAITARVANHLLSFGRDAMTYKMALGTARKEYAKVANLPEEVKTRAVLASAVLAFCSVHLESSILEHAVSIARPMLERHADLLSFTDRRVPLRHMLGAVGFIGLAVGTYYGFRGGWWLHPHVTRHRWLLGVGAPSGSPSDVVLRFGYNPFLNLDGLPQYLPEFVPQVVTGRNGTAAFATMCAGAAVLSRTPSVRTGLATSSFVLYLMAVSQTITLHAINSPTVVTVGFLGSPEYYANLTGMLQSMGAGAVAFLASFLFGDQVVGVEEPTPIPNMLLPPTDDIAAPKYPVAPTLKRRVWEPSPRAKYPRLMAVGVCFDSAVPTYFEGSPETELAALEGRLLIADLPMRPGAWDEMYSIFNRLACVRDFHSSTVPTVTPARRRQWVDKYESGARRDRLLKAITSLEQHPLTAADCVRTLFVKGEKHLAYVGGRWVIACPRAILSSTDRFLVATGPFYDAVHNLMLEHFGSDAPLLYGACSTDVVGKWTDHWILKFGNVLLWWCSDVGRMDGHTQEEHIRAENAWHRAMGMDAECNDAMTHDENNIIIVTTTGLLVVSRPKRASGTANTTTNNTDNTFVMVVGSLPDVECGEDYAFTGHGDDGLGLGPATPELEAAVLDTPRRCLEVGWRVSVDISYDIWDVSYCSRVFWPTTEGPRLGAKIGRFLARFGWALRDDPDWAGVRAAAIGALNDNNHVPFVAELAARVLDLAPRTGRRATARVRRDPHARSFHSSHRLQRTEETWVFLFRRYGLTRRHLEIFNAQLASVTSLPVLIHVPWLVDAIEVDERN